MLQSESSQVLVVHEVSKNIHTDTVTEIWLRDAYLSLFVLICSLVRLIQRQYCHYPVTPSKNMIGYVHHNNNNSTDPS